MQQRTQPVRRQLKKYITYCATSSEYRQQLDKLIRISKSEEWKIAIQLLWSIKNEMAIELLQSSKYTEGDKESKDVTQKVYHNVSEWIDFLANPKLWIQKKGLIQILTSKIKGEAKPEPEKE